MERIFTKEFSYIDKAFEYTPPGWIKIDRIWRPLGFKVVTSKNMSLGLRHNPTPLYFPEHTWVKMRYEDLIFSKADAGGIWSTIYRGDATSLKKYMLTQYNEQAKVYLTALFNPFFANHRVKSQGVMLLEELG